MDIDMVEETTACLQACVSELECRNDALHNEVDDLNSIVGETVLCSMACLKPR